MLSPRVWLITGASSGFGKALAEVLLHKGDIVVATLRKPSMLEHLSEKYPPSQLLVLVLDVTRPSDITAAFDRTREVYGRLDVVFNNAGHGVVGEAEGISNADARGLFDVNFWGMVDVSRAAVNFFREVNPPGKGGVLLQNSSMLAYHAVPGLAFYCASKGAIDGFSESLSKELPLEWNIKICILQPGMFGTNVFAAANYVPLHPAYANAFTKRVREIYQTMSPDGDPYKFADVLHQLVVHADESDEIPLFLPIGEDALQRLQDELRKMNEVAKDVAPWSANLKKDTKAKL